MVGVRHTQCHVADDLIESRLTTQSVLSGKIRSLWRKIRLWYQLVIRARFVEAMRGLEV